MGDVTLNSATFSAIVGLSTSLVALLWWVLRTLVATTKRIEHHVNGIEVYEETIAGGRQVEAPTLSFKVAESAARARKIETQLQEHVSWEMEYRQLQEQRVNAMARQLTEYNNRNEAAHAELKQLLIARKSKRRESV